MISRRRLHLTAINHDIGRITQEFFLFSLRSNDLWHCASPPSFAVFVQYCQMQKVFAPRFSRPTCAKYTIWQRRQGSNLRL